MSKDTDNGQDVEREDAGQVLYDNEQAARDGKPESHPRWKLHKVSHHGVERWVWGRLASHCIYACAVEDGYTAANVDKTVSAANVAACLASMSEEERRAVLAAYLPQKKTK
jgi:hypothetical protein